MRQPGNSELPAVPAPPAAEPPGPYLLDVRVLAELATGVWRLRRRIAEPGTRAAPASGPDEAPDRYLGRQVTALLDTLGEAGIEIQDHQAAAYDPGQAITAVAFQPTPGIDREMVLETVRPTVYLAGREIQRGEVVVGVPEPAPEAEVER